MKRLVLTGPMRGIPLSDADRLAHARDNTEIQRTRSLRAIMWAMELLADAKLAHQDNAHHVVIDHIERAYDRLVVEHDALRTSVETPA